MKKIVVNILLVVMFIAGVAIGTTVAVASAQTAPVPYKLNENQQTYGGINPYSIVPQEEPDLIAAIGVDGTEGYVYSSDLDGEQPATPEEAVKYMEKLEQRMARTRASGEEFLRYIPLYASDGVTVIGEFGISFPNAD